MKKNSLPVASPKTANGKQAKLFDIEIEPIRGYPELRWAGKRPLRSVHFYPAQLMESYGDPTDGWMNRLFWGDNLQVMSHLLREFRGQIRCIYIDPPFDSGADYKRSITLRGKKVSSDRSTFEEKQYADIWANDEYLQFMYERVALLRELLTEDGSIFLHCDHRKAHHLRCVLDEVFGPSKFVNEIVWRSTTFTGSSKTMANRFPVNHNTILWFSKGEYVFNKPRIPYSQEYIDRFTNPDDDPRGPWQSVSLKTYSDETFERLKAEERLIPPQKKGAGWRYKFYLEEAKGKVIETLWLDLNMENSMASGRTGYPTQKPMALLERIIRATTAPGDIVFDAFMGSGTTQAAAMRLGRRFIGADINLGAIETTKKRLLGLMRNIQEKAPVFDLDDADGEPLPDVEDVTRFYLGFDYYLVNNYDLFRNELEAREIILEALEVNRSEHGAIFDGEREGRLVRLMPPNRIATREDLNELITRIDIKRYLAKQKEQPNRPVLKVLLVCMGHEPGLGAFLEQEMERNHLKVDVEVLDILRDRADLRFKRESAVRVVCSKNKLNVKSFYPMNLLQKLSLSKDSIQDWKELVQSIMIDWNYDGKTFRPTLLDIPADEESLVSGTYEVPADASRIACKVTDLLDESIVVEVSNGR